MEKFPYENYKPSCYNGEKSDAVGDQHQFSNSKYHFEKQTLCEVCGKNFSNPSDLMVHGFYHRVEQSYRCHYCYSCYQKESELLMHIFTMHPELKVYYGSALYNLKRYCKDIFEMEKKYESCLCRITSRNANTSNLETVSWVKSQSISETEQRKDISSPETGKWSEEIVHQKLASSKARVSSDTEISEENESDSSEEEIDEELPISKARISSNMEIPEENESHSSVEEVVSKVFTTCPIAKIPSNMEIPSCKSLSDLEATDSSMSEDKQPRNIRKFEAVLSNYSAAKIQKDQEDYYQLKCYQPYVKLQKLQNHLYKECIVKGYVQLVKSFEDNKFDNANKTKSSVFLDSLSNTSPPSNIKVVTVPVKLMGKFKETMLINSATTANYPFRIVVPPAMLNKFQDISIEKKTTDNIKVVPISSKFQDSVQDDGLSLSTQSSIKTDLTQTGMKIIKYGVEDMRRDNLRRKVEKEEKMKKEGLLKKMLAKYDEKEKRKKLKYYHKVLSKFLIKYQHHLGNIKEKLLNVQNLSAESLMIVLQELRDISDTKCKKIIMSLLGVFEKGVNDRSLKGFKNLSTPKTMRKQISGKKSKKLGGHGSSIVVKRTAKTNLINKSKTFSNVRQNAKKKSNKGTCNISNLALKEEFADC